jgi:hypothetical protein
MKWISGLLLVARQAFGQSFRGGRLFALLLLVLVPVLIATAISYARGRVNSEAYAWIMLFFVYQVVVPFIGLFLGVGALGDEIEGRTITYLFTRPIPRPVLYVGRLLGYAAGFSLLLAAAVLAIQALLGRRIPGLETGGATAAAIAVGGFCAYLALFALLRTLFRRALYLGAFLAFVFEGLVSKLPGARISQISIWHHMAVLFTKCADTGSLDPDLVASILPTETARGSALALAVTFGAALLAGAVLVHRREVHVPAAAA